MKTQEKLEERHINWRELFGNKFRFSPHPLMLSKDGYQVKIVTKLTGESKLLDFPVVVTFDEAYVVEYIARIIQLLHPQKYNDWQKVVSKAYACWNEKKDKQVQQ